MEQDDSLRVELQNLSRLQSEQVEILKSMHDAQRQDATLKNMSSAPNADMFTNTNMYQNAAPQFDQGYADFQPQLVSPYSQNTQANFGSHIQNIQSGKSQYGLLNILSPGTQYSVMARDLMSMDYGSKVSKAGVAGLGAAASTAASFGLSAMVPGLAGLGIGIGAGAVTGLYVDAANDQIDRQNALNKYIYKNSNKFINSFESDNDRALGGFSRKDSVKAADYVRKMNTDFYLSDDEMATLLQSYTEGGLLKDVKDLESFKDKMKTLTKTVKEGALILNETYDSISDLMAEMKKAGIDVKDFNSNAGLANIIGQLNGLDGSDVLRDLINYTVNVNNGTGNDADDTLSRVEDMSIYMSEYFNQLEDKTDRNPIEESNYNMIKNLGGAVEASKYINSTIENMMGTDDFITAGMAFFDYDTSTKTFQFDKNAYNSFVKGDMTYRQMYDNAEEKYDALVDSGNGAAITLWKDQGSTYLKNNLGEGDMTALVAKVVGALTSDPEFAENGFDFRTALSKMGITDGGVQDLLSGVIEFKGDNPDLTRQVKLQNLWQQQVATELSKAPSLTQRVGAWWENVKEGATNGAVYVNNFLGQKIQDISDKWNGVEKLPERLDKTFIMRSDMKRVSYDEVLSGLSQANDMIGMTKTSMTNLTNNGFSVDDKLMDYVKSKYDVTDKSVTYSRDLITRWDKVDKDIINNKDLVQDIALQNKISEIIVSSLVKYKQLNPDKNVDVNTMSEKFGENMFNYGGNEMLAQAASATSREQVDDILRSQGINIDGLRAAGAQEQLKDYNINNLGLSEEILAIMKQFFGQNIFVDGGGGSGSGKAGNYEEEITPEDLLNRPLNQPSGVTAEDIDLLIAKEIEKRGADNTILEVGMGKYFIEAEEKTGVDALYWYAHAMHESGYGTSDIVKAKNNWYGWGAVDSNPMGGAWAFDDKGTAIVETAEKIAANYQNSDKNQQDTLYKMRWGKPGHNYASDGHEDDDPKSWDEKIADTWSESINYLKKNGASLNYETDTRGYTKEEKVVKDVYGEDMSESLKHLVDAKYEGLKSTEDYWLNTHATARAQKAKEEADKEIEKLQQQLEVAKNLKVGRKDLGHVDMNDSYMEDGVQKYRYVLNDGSRVTEDEFKVYVQRQQEDKKTMVENLEQSIDNKKVQPLTEFNTRLGLENETVYDIEVYKEKYSEMLQGAVDFADGVDSEAAQQWKDKKAADKLSTLEMLKEMERLLPNIKETNIIDYNDYFTQLEKESFKSFTGGHKNKTLDGSVTDSNSDAYDYRLWLNQGEKKVDSDEAVEKYLKAREGFGDATDKASLDDARNFINQARQITDAFKEEQVEVTADHYDELVSAGYNLRFNPNTESKQSFADKLNKYRETLRDELNSKQYEGVEDVVGRSEKLKKAEEDIMYFFQTKEQGENYLQSIQETQGLRKELNPDEKYNILQSFGAEYYGIKASDFNGRMDLYNKELNMSANSFYSLFSKGFKDYISDTESDESNLIKNLSAMEKSTYYEAMKQIQYALGIEDEDAGDGYESVEEIFKGDKSKIYNEDEIETMRHIDENGMYRATYYNDTQNTDDLLERFEKYLETGQQESKTSGIQADLIASGVGQGVDSGNTLLEIREAIKEQIELSKKESNDAISAAQKMAEAITGGNQGVGFSASEDEIKRIAEALRWGDTEYLEALKKEKSGGEGAFNEDAFNRILEAAKNASAPLDISGLNDLLTTMQNIENIIKDTGTASSALYKGGDDMGGFKEIFESEMREGMKKVFGETSDITNANLEELIVALNNGGGKVNDIEISANTLEQLAVITANAVDAGLKQTLSADGGIEVITDSNLYKSVKTDSLDAIAEEIKKKSKEIQKVGESTEEGLALASQQKDLIDTFTQQYQESLKQLGDTASGTKNEVDDINKKTQETIDSFNTTMSKYDGALRSAVVTMQGTIDKLKSESQPEPKRSFPVISAINPWA